MKVVEDICRGAGYSNAVLTALLCEPRSPCNVSIMMTSATACAVAMVASSVPRHGIIENWSSAHPLGGYALRFAVIQSFGIRTCCSRPAHGPSKTTPNRISDGSSGSVRYSCTRYIIYIMVSCYDTRGRK